MLDAMSAYSHFSAATLITVATTVVLVSAIHVAMKWLVKLKERRDARAPASEFDAPPSVRRWIRHGLRESIRPLALFIWIHGLHFALTALLADLDGTALARRGAQVFDGLQGIGTVVALAWLLLRVGRTIEAALVSYASRTEKFWDKALAPFAGKAARLLLPLLAIILGVPALAFSPEMANLIKNAVSLLLIGTMAFLLLQLLNAGAALVLQRQQIDVSDNRRARAIYTQVMMLRKIAVTVLAVLAVASMLMVFDSVRHFGATILASAGVAGLVIGFAAQKSLATLLAGIQIAMTQPIRIDDVVIVENEWGRIEEITLTYVVVRIWDLRRLVLPITYFIENPFQNWTRTSADILGSVFLYMDYQVPLEELRAEFTRILDRSPLWDRKVAVLQVTDAKERTVEIRALMSAPDASTAWDLRCDVREKLIVYLQRNHPESLPRLRATFEESPAARRQLPATASGTKPEPAAGATPP